MELLQTIWNALVSLVEGILLFLLGLFLIFFFIGLLIATTPSALITYFGGSFLERYRRKKRDKK